MIDRAVHRKIHSQEDKQEHYSGPKYLIDFDTTCNTNSVRWSTMQIIDYFVYDFPQVVPYKSQDSHNAPECPSAHICPLWDTHKSVLFSHATI